MKKSRIAILGATSHIAKGLINNFLDSNEFNLHLYTRSPDKVDNFLECIGKPVDNGCVIHEGYRDFDDFSYDAVINCVGVGTKNELKGNYSNDVASAKPVEKAEILEYFSSEYGLKFEVNQSLSCASATGVKDIYCSNYNNAASVGYKPAFSSMNTIKQESKYILDANAK